MKVVIDVAGLSKHYGKGGEIKAVDELDLQVYEGETFGLLGPNGAGKTTTVRLLNCIIKPSGGTALVNGFDIIDEKTEVKKATGLLAESPGLYEKLSGKEFLEFMGALYDVPDNILGQRIDELLKLFSLYKRRDYLLEGYSRGMKQKILIAAALIHDPPIVFLDEPTSMLYQVWALFRTMEECSQPGTNISIDSVKAQADHLILEVIQTLEGNEESLVVKHLLQLRKALDDQHEGGEIPRTVNAARDEVMNIVNNFFYDKLTTIPEIKNFMSEMGG